MIGRSGASEARAEIVAARGPVDPAQSCEGPGVKQAAEAPLETVAALRPPHSAQSCEGPGVKQAAEAPLETGAALGPADSRQFRRKPGDRQAGGAPPATATACAPAVPARCRENPDRRQAGATSLAIAQAPVAPGPAPSWPQGTARRPRVAMLPVALALAGALALGTGCGLMPVPKRHVVQLTFQLGKRERYALDPADSIAAFRMDGLVVKADYLTKQELNAEYPEESGGRINLNPFTYGTRMDNDLGYVPDRFTVFEIELNNIGLPKVAFDPTQARLLTGRGGRLRPWGVEKGDADKTFEEYYRARRGAGGNDQDWYRQRMAIVQRDVCTGDRPLFKGQRHKCKLVFDVLHPDVQRVRLLLPDVVVGFDASGLPNETVDLEFPFTVSVYVAPVDASARTPRAGVSGCQWALERYGSVRD